MFELKVQFLEDENFALRRQVSSLQKILAVESDSNEKSLLHQLRRSNEQLATELQAVKDQLFLEREVREIQKTEHEEIVNQLNRSIFELNLQLSLLEEAIREEKRLEYKPNCIQQWFKEKLQCTRNEVYHNYADPLLFFEVLQNILDALQEKQSHLFSSALDEQTDSQPEQKEEDISSSFKVTDSRMVAASPLAETKSPNRQVGESSIMRLKGESKWSKERSSLHFLKSKKVRDLHLNLSAAKIVQFNYVRAQQQAQGKKWVLNTNVDLLRKSYVVLIGQHQNLKKKNRLLCRYIEELEHRNNLLVKSRLEHTYP